MYLPVYFVVSKKLYCTCLGLEGDTTRHFRVSPDGKLIVFRGKYGNIYVVSSTVSLNVIIFETLFDAVSSTLFLLLWEKEMMFWWWDVHCFQNDAKMFICLFYSQKSWFTQWRWMARLMLWPLTTMDHGYFHLVMMVRFMFGIWTDGSAYTGLLMRAVYKAHL